MTAPTVQLTADRRVVVAFLRGQVRKSTFASSLVRQFEEKGGLTDRQWAAAERMLAQAKAGRPEDEAQAEPEPTVDLTSLPAGKYAVPDGDTRLKVLVERPTEGDWADWIFVKDAAVYGQGQKYGHQRPGSTVYSGKIVDELRIIAADPLAAMIAYGKLTETCGYCGRPLEREDSVARGIGPVCAKKMGG